MLCHWASVPQHFEGTQCLHLKHSNTVSRYRYTQSVVLAGEDSTISVTKHHVPEDWYPEQQSCKNLKLSAICILHLHSLLNLLAHLYEPVINLTCLDLRHFLLQLQVHGLLLLHQSLQLTDPLCNI